MLLANIILALTSLMALFLGLFILASNPRKPVNRALSALIFSVFIWQVANLFTNISASPSAALFFARTTLIGPCIIAYSFLLFCKIFTEAKNFGYKQALQVGIIPFGIVVLFPTKLNVVSIEPYGYNAQTGPLYFVLIPLILVYFSWGLVLLYKLRKKTRDPIRRAQIRLIFAGILFTLIPALVSNGILPALGYSDAASYGPSVVIILAICMAIAIIRHRLLDIKLIVARSVAYVLLLGSLSVVFAGLVITVPASVIGADKPSLGRQIYYTFAAIALAFGFQPLRKFFDKLTNKLFYQDAYDPQEFLEELNGVIVSNIELDILLRKCIEIIERNMKVEFCLFGIRETTYSRRRLIGNDHRKFSEEDIQKVRAATPSIHQRIIVTDELDEGHEHLRKVLAKNDIAIIGRLSTDIVHTAEGIGYLVLGPKKSGNLFNRQDARVLEIITKELVVAIQNAMRFEEIQNFNLTLQKKVDSATNELRRSNEKLKELDETKDDFISMASHQLRTPLTSVKGYLSMVLEGDAGKLNPNQAKLLDQAFVSSQRMVFLISDLLNLSRLKTGKFVVEASPVNLSEIIEGEVDQLIETAAARGLKLTFEKPDTFPALMFDETKIRQVIMNFVDNAIYYTPSGGNIKVSLNETPHSVEFTVKDDGIGVPKHEQHHLFTKFYRAGNAKKARPDGTGLGLFMAKKVIIAQGGSVLFSSQEGKGSTFGFTFSKAKLKPPTITPKPEVAVKR
jgi:signal transduction histidine kinase